MLTREECVVGAHVVGVWDDAEWAGTIKEIRDNYWYADLVKQPDDGDRDIVHGRYAPGYSLSFNAPAMRNNFTLLKNMPKPHKPIKSWSLACQKH